MPTARLRLPLAALGAAAGICAIALAIWEPDALTLPVAVHVAIGWSFLVAGSVAWKRQPENRTGLLMMLTGVVWFGRDIDWWGGAIPTHLSDLSQNVFLALIAHQVIVFPHGAARTRFERALVDTVYALALGGYVLSELSEAANDALSVVAIIVLVAIVLVVVERWRAASVPERRVLAPLLCAGPAVLTSRRSRSLATISTSRSRRRATPLWTGPNSSTPPSPSPSSPGYCESGFSVPASAGSSSSSAAGSHRRKAFVTRSLARSAIRRSRSPSGFPTAGATSTRRGGASSPRQTAGAP